MCVKINVLYVQYAFLFTLAGPTHLARISKNNDAPDTKRV